MGEKQNQPFQLSFNASLKVDFQGLRVTSGGGLILVRELDDRLAFGELIAGGADIASYVCPPEQIELNCAPAPAAALLWPQSSALPDGEHLSPRPR